MVIRTILYLTLSGIFSCNNNKAQKSADSTSLPTTQEAPAPAGKPAKSASPIDTSAQVEVQKPVEPVKEEPVNQEPAVGKQNETRNKNTYFEIERTPCFGKCPVYKMTIQADGMATLMAQQNMEYEGTYTKRVEKKTINMLVEEFEKAGFFNMKDEYTAQVMDLPTTWVTFKHNGKYKKIKDHYKAPPVLKELEKLLDNIAVGSGWQKKSE